MLSCPLFRPALTGRMAQHQAQQFGRAALFPLFHVEHRQPDQNIEHQRRIVKAHRDGQGVAEVLLCGLIFAHCIHDPAQHLQRRCHAPAIIDLPPNGQAFLDILLRDIVRSLLVSNEAQILQNDRGAEGVADLLAERQAFLVELLCRSVLPRKLRHQAEISASFCPSPFNRVSRCWRKVA